MSGAGRWRLALSALEAKSPSTYYDARRAVERPSGRHARDEVLAGEVARVYAQNYGVYGARMVWAQLNREHTPVARCTVERLMWAHGLAGARRGRQVRTTIQGDGVRAADLVERHFDPPAPDRLWVADFTYVPTWSEMVYVAFVIDAYSRRILGWRAATTTRTELVPSRRAAVDHRRATAALDEFEHARPLANGTRHHRSDAGNAIRLAAHACTRVDKLRNSTPDHGADEPTVALNPCVGADHGVRSVWGGGGARAGRRVGSSAALRDGGLPAGSEFALHQTPARRDISRPQLRRAGPGSLHPAGPGSRTSRQLTPGRTGHADPATGRCASNIVHAVKINGGARLS